MRAKRWPFLLDALVVLFATAYVLSFFKIPLMMNPLTPSGGDSAGQFFTSWFVRYHVFQNGHLSGWCPGQYAGYPALQYYFPLPFLLISLASLAVPIQVAFKWVTALGPACMPVCAYFYLRWLDVKFPGPAVGSVFSLFFLFNEGNSMWGGNMPSMLAGEFAYSLSFALSLLFLGSLYKGVQENGRLRTNAVLLTLVGLSHACGLLYSGAMGFFFLFDRRNARRNLIYIFKVWTWSFLLLGFWLIPVLSYVQYTTPFNFVWVVSSWREALPPILRPPVLLGISYLLVRFFRRTLSQAEMFLGFGVALAGLLYLVGFELHVPDIRFVPYAQVLLVLSAAFAVASLASSLRGTWLISLLMLLGGVFWVNRHVAYVPQWIYWNYSGVEAKPTWPQLQELVQAVAGSVKDPRVAYENSPDHNRFGTMRIFELLPYFSGRSTLEGLYIQDSISSPFIYLIQAEISKDQSQPVPGYYYPYQYLRAGIEHLKLFNTKYLILVSDMMKKEAARIPEIQLRKSSPPYEIYELLKNDGQYVTPLKYKPVVYIGADWKKASYNWFRQPALLDFPMILNQARSKEPELAELAHVPTLAELPPQPYPKVPIVQTVIQSDEIIIHTSEIGHPLMIKVSYHPRWKVDGASQIYMVSPSFMLIFPRENTVRLHFGHTLADAIGLAATLLALLAMFAGAPLTRWDPFILRGWKPTRRFQMAVFVFGGLGGLWIAWNAWHRPQKIESRAMAYYDRKQYEKALPQFEDLHQRYPQTAIAYRALFFAAICDGLLGRTAQAEVLWEQLLRDFPDGFYSTEGYFRKWKALTLSGQTAEAEEIARQLFERFPNSYWTGQLKEQRKRPS